MKKPKIQDIVVDKSKMQKLEKILSSNASPFYKREAIKDTTGECRTCFKIPTKKIFYQLEDAIKVERYCPECFTKWDKDKNERRR